MQALELLEPTGPSCARSPFEPISVVRFLRNSNLVSREVAGETVVVPICRGVGDLDSIFTFNGVGTYLWALLAEGRTAAELCQFVEQRYAVSADMAQADVRSFLSDLQEIGLVQTA